MTDVEAQDEVIFIEKAKDEEFPRAKCTCGTFETEPENNLLLLGIAAKAHELETGHLRRSHNGR